MQFIFTVLLGAILIAISWIDIQKLRIPNYLNLLLFLSGLIFVATAHSDSFLQQIVTCGVVYSLAWTFRFAHLKLTGRVGLGLGDVKMFGASAVWLDPTVIPLFVFIASGFGLIFAVLILKLNKNQRMPLGPFIALSLFSCWVGDLHL